MSGKRMGRRVRCLGIFDKGEWGDEERREDAKWLIVMVGGWNAGTGRRVLMQ